MGARRKDRPKPASGGSHIVVEGGRSRVHVESPLMMESLMDKGLIGESYLEAELPVLPDVDVVHLGGRSIIDRGAEILPALLEEIVAARARHRIVIGVGGGIRERHTYAQCIDLGIPTGGLAQLVGVMCKQNATMVFYLLARQGGVRVPREEFTKIPFYLDSGGIPVIVDMPPYHFWEFVSGVGRIPLHRPDSGTFLLSEVYSCRSCIFVKDVDGIYTADPKTNPEARHLPRVGVNELRDLDPPDLPLEPTLLDLLGVARNRKEIRLVNGLVPGALTRALDGEDVGTVLFQD